VTGLDFVIAYVPEWGTREHEHYIQEALVDDM
jgi:hypothetical protein